MGEFRELLETLTIFVIMGILSVIAQVNKATKKLSLRKKFNMFYLNTVSGWGLFTLVTAKYEWFGVYPQKVFTIMALVYVGFSTLEFLKKKKLLGRFLANLLTNDKK